MAEKTAKKSPVVDYSDLVTAAGLVLVTIGVWQWAGPAALSLPGLVLVWYALPTRPPFVKPQDR